MGLERVSEAGRAGAEIVRPDQIGEEGARPCQQGDRIAGSDAPGDEVVRYYDQLAPRYDDDRFGNSYGAYVDRLERALLRDWLKGLDPREVIDVGCGTGRLLAFAATGLDASRPMLAQAARKFPDRRLLQADLAHWPAELPALRAAFCFHVLMHVGEAGARALFREAARHLQSGARLIVDIPSAQRRRLGRRPASGWHGDTAATADELAAWAGPQWRLSEVRGLLMLPIHRLPGWSREAFSGLDQALGRSPLRGYGSYLAVAFERTDHPPDP